MGRWLMILSCITAFALVGAEAALADDAAALAGDAAALSQWIDREIDERLASEGIERVREADDAEFLRRVYLDLHGVIPTAQQASRFLQGDDPGKRAALVDELLASPRFGEHLGDVWRKRLISPQANEQRVQSDRFADWLAERFHQNVGWDRIVRELLTANGKLDENPAVTYAVEGRYPLSVSDLTDLTSRYFLGVRLNCAQCHDHPFAAWKREDYWGMAAFFAQIQTPGRPKVVYLAGVRDDPKMSLASLASGEEIDGFLQRPPIFLGGRPHEEDGRPTRAALADWMTSPDNPYFARAAVNRMWWHFFGRGIVSPVDDMHEGNAPSHPRLLSELSRRFAESGFDLKFLCRAIVTSRTYQQTSRPGKQEDAEAKNFARMSAKVLTAEQLYDSLVTVLGPPTKAPGIDVRLGARYEFCRSFASSGESEPTAYERGIPHLLRLMNSPQFSGRNLSALARRITENDDTQDAIASELYLTILSRMPTADERQIVRKHLASEGGAAETACQELAWALLMSSEFSLNH